LLTQFRNLLVLIMKDIFDFLDDLRESGDINMFGAGPVLQEVFDLSRHEARAVLSDWMKQFSVDN
jgi:hypothetical protein